MSNVPPCFVGHWKFSKQVPLDDLAALARQWSHRVPHYLHLAVRTISPDHLAIVFAYQPPDHLARESTYANFLTATSRKLKRRFGEFYEGFDIDCQGRLIK